VIPSDVFQNLVKIKVRIDAKDVGTSHARLAALLGLAL
jgi:hypothetical protein